MKKSELARSSHDQAHSLLTYVFSACATQPTQCGNRRGDSAIFRWPPTAPLARQASRFTPRRAGWRQTRFLHAAGPPAALCTALRAGRDAGRHLMPNDGRHVFLAALNTYLPAVATLTIILALSSAGCRTPPVATRTDAEIERNVAMARSAYAAGAVEKAAGYYQKALQRARVMDDSAAIARNAYNLAACLAALGSYDQAKACLDGARLEFERNNLPCPELPLLSARIARALGQLQEAESLARSQLAKRQELNAALQVQWQLLMAELKCDQSKAVEAGVELLGITPRTLQACGADIQAETALTQARVQLLRRDLPEAARQYDAAAGYWQNGGRYNEMAAALHYAARAYEAAGNSAAAADRYYRAARSLFESGQTREARELARAAEKLAGAAKASALQKQANRLQTEIDLQIQKRSVDNPDQENDEQP